MEQSNAYLGYRLEVNVSVRDSKLLAARPVNVPSTDRVQFTDATDVLTSVGVKQLV